MKKGDRRCEIDNISDDMYYSFGSLVANMHRLEEIGCKAEAKKLDTIVGKLENLCRQLTEKARNL